MSFGIPVRNGLAVGLTPSTTLSSGRVGGRPALQLNFLSGTLDSRITFTRGSTATFVGSNGLIQSAAINAPRFDYDPVTLAPRGLLIEEARTNLLLNSPISGVALPTQSVTVTAVPHTISFYGTGTITLSGVSVATVVGAGAYPNRQTLTFTPTAGVLVCTVVGLVQFAQLEVGSFATSFIPTAGTTAARSADVASMTGTNFSSWYNAAEGTVVSTWNAIGYSNANIVTCISDSGTTNLIQQFLQSSTNARFSVRTLGVDQASLDATVTTTAVNRLASAYKANDFASTVNGATVSTDAVGTIPTVDRLGIGSRLGTLQWNGHIRAITYYNTRLPNTSLQALTA
jgi:hypothetical protein